MTGARSGSGDGDGNDSDGNGSDGNHSNRNDGDGGDFDPVSFLEAAVEIPSHEAPDAMREFLLETLESQGVDARVDEAGNVLASRGTDEGEAAGGPDAGGPHYVLNTHIDTVAPHVPFEREEGVIRGRGACDAKGALAPILAAFFATDPGSGRLTLAITPDEEILSIGAHELVSDPDSPVHDADGVIVGEPTGLDVCLASKGRFQGTISLTGANAHAAEPESGINAIAALEAVLSAIGTFGDRDDAPPDHPELGRASLTPTVVEGGTATNQVPADCRLTVDRRSVPPETAETFDESLSAHLREAVPDEVGVEFAFTDRQSPFLEAWETDDDDPLVRTLAETSGGAIRPFTAATEASYFAEHAPTVVFGPGELADDEGAVAHSPREYVRVAEVRTAAAALEACLSRLFQ